MGADDGSLASVVTRMLCSRLFSTFPYSPPGSVTMSTAAARARARAAHAERAPLLREYDRGGNRIRDDDDDVTLSARARSLGSRLRTALHNPGELSEHRSIPRLDDEELIRASLGASNLAGRLTALEKALAAAFLVALLLTGLFAGLFGGSVVKYKHYKHRHEHENHRYPPPRPTTTVTATGGYPGPTGRPLPPPAPPRHPKDPNAVCLTADCVRSAAKILSSLDTTVDPCHDFYSFANGNWLADHPIPPGKASFSVMSDIGDRNRRIIKGVLERDSESEKHLDKADKENLANLRAFWTSCNNEEILDKVGSQPLYALAEEAISLWRGEEDESVDVLDAEAEEELDLFLQSDEPSYEIATKKHKKHKKHKNKGKKGRWNPKTRRERLTNALAFLHSRGIDALFGASGDGDVGNDPKQVVLWLSQSGLGLPSKDYYKDKAVVTDYEETIATVLDNVYSSRKESAMTGLAADVIAFEKKLAKISLDLDKLSEPGLTYNPFNASDLQDLFPSISFGNYFASLGPRPRFPEPVVVMSPEYFRSLTKLIDATGPEVLEAYLVAQVGMTYANLLGAKEPIRVASDRFIHGLMGITTAPPRSEVCLDLLDRTLGFSVGRYFVEEAFPGDSKKYGEEVIRAIIAAFQARLPARTWLDAETRQKAKEKVEAIEYKVRVLRSPQEAPRLSLKLCRSVTLSRQTRPTPSRSAPTTSSTCRSWTTTSSATLCALL